MNRFYAASSCVAACIALCSVSAHEAFAQAGPPVTRQMQDTQRAAQKKAREAHSAPHTQKKEKSDKSPMPASAAQ